MFSLWSTLKSTKTPSYIQGDEEDSIDLQIKSLLYCFRRLRINRLSSFLGIKEGQEREYELKYVTGFGSSSSDMELASEYYQKLDNTYNIAEFQKILIEDEYRVMCDYIKNKFRSFCIVTEMPSNSVLKGDHENRSFPSIVDYKDRPVKNFGFTVLPCEKVNTEIICGILSLSFIYTEHVLIGLPTRYQYAKQCIESVLPLETLSLSSYNITKDQRAKIIQGYLKKMAFNVQLNRIYEEYMKKNGNSSQLPSAVLMLPTLQRSSFSSSTALRASTSMSSTTLTPSTTPSNLTSNSLTRFDAPKMSPSSSERSLLRSPSPTRRLNKKPSISKLRLGELYNPVVSPQSTTTDVSQKRNNPEIRIDVWDKCKLAVSERLSREKKLLSMT